MKVMQLMHLPADAPVVDVMTPEEAVVSSDDATMTQRRVIH